VDGSIKVANGNMVPLNYGLGYSQWTASDLAKVGHLYLTNGKWKDKRILLESFVKESFTDIPFKINPWFTSHPQSETRLAKTGYGLGWWTDRGSDLKVWAMQGYGMQFCIVLPDYGVVMTKLNDWRPRPDNCGQADFTRIIRDCFEPGPKSCEKPFMKKAPATPENRGKPKRRLDSHGRAPKRNEIRSGQVVYPGAEWERRTPEELGMDMNALASIDRLMEKAQANGVLIHNGYLVREWTNAGPSDAQFNVKSITKSILGMVYALAIDDGLIPGPEAKVKDFWPDFDAGPYAAEITFHHLASATSGLKATGPYWQHFTGHGSGVDFRPPGMPGKYHNDHCMYLAGALTYLFERDLLEVLRERILMKIGADANWTTNGEDAPVDIAPHGFYRSANRNEQIVPPGYVTLRDGRRARWVTGFSRSYWTAHDLARVGWLFLNDGQWEGRPLIHSTNIEECHKHIPDRPYLSWRCPTDYKWWSMMGAGAQFCVLIPEHKIVMTKINEWRNEKNVAYRGRPQVGIREFAPHLNDLFSGR